MNSPRVTLLCAKLMEFAVNNPSARVWVQYDPHTASLNVFSVLKSGQYDPYTESGYSETFKNDFSEPGIETVYLNGTDAAEHLDSLIVRVRSIINQSEAVA